MIRANRDRRKLLGYYHKYIEHDELDTNVHPWVAESWRRSRRLGVKPDVLSLKRRLGQDEYAERISMNALAIEYLRDMTDGLDEFLSKYTLCMLLVDRDGAVLENFGASYSDHAQLVGKYVGEEDIGTSSVSIVMEHHAPFVVFGPEMWVEECQSGDACSVPVMHGGKLRYVVTISSRKRDQSLHPDALYAEALTIGRALERYLQSAVVRDTAAELLDSSPFAVYNVLPDGTVNYANRLGLERLSANDGDVSSIDGSTNGLNLSKHLLNYKHTPIYRGFDGHKCVNQESTWITHARTYEDVTTVIPRVGNAGVVKSVSVISMPMKDLRSLVAHAADYTAKYTLSSMVGSGETFDTMIEKAENAARRNGNVLIYGEPGTGKQRLAHGIHNASPFQDGPFIALRCTDVAPDVLSRELFGSASENGTHQGKIELAAGGRIFLDEIDKLPLALQDKLYETLSTGKLQRIGEDIYRNVDVNVIAASDTDLKKLVARGIFSRDLYRLIAQNVILVPPLRRRKEDLRLVAENILSDIAAQHHEEARKLTDDAVEKLKSYDWPGNIKELQRVMERAQLGSSDPYIHADDVDILGRMPEKRLWKDNKEAFLKVWRAHGGNVSHTAAALEVSRVTVYRYLKKYGLME